MSGESAIEAVVAEVEAAVEARAVAVAPVAGGSINSALRVELDSGDALFVKHRAGSRPGEYAAEAAGLSWLADGGARVPTVVSQADSHLALEWIDTRGLASAAEPELGVMLAGMHLAGAPTHGSLPPQAPPGLSGVGSLSLPAVESEDWNEVYARARLLPPARIAHERGRLGDRDLAAVEAVCGRLPQIAGDPEPPARLHGDLWSGNVIADGSGAPLLIDPTAYGGHREVDLAMLRLFGGPSRRAYDAYAERYPLAAGHEDRVELWQLSPLLVHAALFGGSYGPAAGRIARRYAGSHLG